MEQQSQESIQRAFEHFMLSGNKRGGVDDVEESSRHVPASKVSKSPSNEQKWKKVEKQYWKIINAFQGTLERDWLHVDGQLEQVVSSISNLRGRIQMESRYLRDHFKGETTNTPLWKQYGHHTTSGSNAGLTRDDVELALSHDLCQHEKMMAGARTLLASLSQAQDALGRRLEELLLFHMDTLQGMEQDPDESPSTLFAVMGAVDKLQTVFASLALELYRKQVLIQDLLDAINDDLLVRNHGEADLFGGDGGMDVNPRRVADKCVREWPRGSKASQVDVTALNGLLELGGLDTVDDW